MIELHRVGGGIVQGAKEERIGRDINAFVAQTITNARLIEQPREKPRIHITCIATASATMQSAFVRVIGDIRSVAREHHDPREILGERHRVQDSPCDGDPLRQFKQGVEPRRRLGLRSVMRKAQRIAHQLAEQPVRIVGTPQRLDPKKPIAALLKEQPFILPTGDNSVRTAFDALASRLAVRPQIVAEVDDMAMMRLLAREDIGLALVAPVVVKDELANGRFVEALDHPQIREAFYAITLRRRFPNPLVQQLLGAGSAPETIDNSQRS